MATMQAQTLTHPQWAASEILFRRPTMDPKQRFYHHFLESVSGKIPSTFMYTMNDILMLD